MLEYLESDWTSGISEKSLVKIKFFLFRTLCISENFMDRTEFQLLALLFYTFYCMQLEFN